jgi:hypothetical protein
MPQFQMASGHCAQSSLDEGKYFAHPFVDSCLPKPGCFTYLFQVHKINFHRFHLINWMHVGSQLNVGSKSGGVGSLFDKYPNKTMDFTF